MIGALTGNEMLKIFRRKRFRVVVLILVCLTAMIAYGNWRSRRDAALRHGPRDWRAETQTIYFDKIVFWNAEPTGHPDWGADPTPQ